MLVGWLGGMGRKAEEKGRWAQALFERLSQARQKIGQRGNDYCRVRRCIRSVV